MHWIPLALFSIFVHYMWKHLSHYTLGNHWHVCFIYCSLKSFYVIPKGICSFVKVTQSCLTVTPWTLTCQASLSIEFSWSEYWNGLPFLPPGDLPDPEIEHGSPTLQVDSLPLSHQGSPGSLKSMSFIGLLCPFHGIILMVFS